VVYALAEADTRLVGELAGRVEGGGMDNFVQARGNASAKMCVDERDGSLCSMRCGWVQVGDCTMAQRLTTLALRFVMV
jgi:hypothetical protein